MPRLTIEYSGNPWKLVSAARPVTVRHLLTHTAGLARPPIGITPQEFADISRRQSPNETIGDFVRRYAKAPLSYHPGRKPELVTEDNKKDEETCPPKKST